MSYLRSSAALSHDSLVSASVAEMQRQMMVGIRADHIRGYTQPDTLGGFIPDVTGYLGNALCIVEAETADGLGQQHTADQWRAFHSHAVKAGGYFIVSVNRADEATAQTLFRTVIGSSDRVRFWTF